MMAVHELGHALGAWMTGGTVTKVVLYPLVFSRTEVYPNPEPLPVVWSGPLFGVGIPCLLWLVSCSVRLRVAYLVRFFCGFCLVSNGAYIGVASLEGLGDAGDMLRLGSPIWSLWLFGVLTLVGGFAAWNGQSHHFGLGESKRDVSGAIAYTTAALCFLVLLCSFCWGNSA